MNHQQSPWKWILACGMALFGWRASAVNYKASEKFSSMREQSCSQFSNPTQYNNCLLVFQRLPPMFHPALEYSMRFLAGNRSMLSDRSCMRSSGRVSPSAIQTIVQRGVSQCRFVVNLLSKNYKNFTHRSPAVYINLCSTNPLNKGKDGGLLAHFYANRGTSSLGSDFRDTTASSAAGAYITSGPVTDFTPYSDSKGSYAQLRSQYGNAKRLQLVGVDPSNNKSSDKIIHESLYQSSHGCPSIHPENRWIIKELSRQPSLFLNYVSSQKNPISSLNSAQNKCGGGTRNVARKSPANKVQRSMASLNSDSGGNSVEDSKSRAVEP